MTIQNICMQCDRQYYSDYRKDSLCPTCMEGEEWCQGQDCVDEVATREHDGKHYCDDCYVLYVQTCEDCGVIHEPGLVYVGDNDAGVPCRYCPECAVKDVFADLHLTDQIVFLHFAAAAVVKTKARSGTDLHKVLEDTKEILLRVRESQ